MRIGFLGFGEAARALQQSLKAQEPGLTFSAYDILLDDPGSASPMQAAMAERDVAEANPETLCAANWIFSAVTADQSHFALQNIASHLHQGQLVIDINSVSPDRKRQGAELVEAASAHYLDMAVMAPVAKAQHQTPTIVAGHCLDAVRPELQRLAFTFTEAGDQPGAATAIKMVRSLFVKGLEALTVETLLAAKASGCFDEIFASLAKSYPGLGWPEFADYEFERTLRHGKRRAAEMRESAATITALGLNGELANQIAETQGRMGRAGEAGIPEGEIADLVAAILERRSGSN